MQVTRYPKAIAYLLVWTIMVSSLAFGQMNASVTSSTGSVQEITAADYLIEVAGAETNSSYIRETEAVERILNSTSSKNAVVIDNSGYAREIVAQAVAARLARRGEKRLFRVNWNAVFAAAEDEAKFENVLNSVLGYAKAQKANIAIYIDDIAGFSIETSMFGAKIAQKLYKALVQGDIQVLTASDASAFESQIAGDTKLRSRFQRVAITDKNDDDSFVGDKLSPDLRELVAGADQNRTVKVILQSDDINNPQLLNVLTKNNVAIETRADSLNMMVVDLPVRVAEQVAAVKSAKHLSLDRQVDILGHIETTTGVAQIRKIQTGVSLLGIPIFSDVELDGRNIGIAIVDSGVREDHRSFVDANGNKRITENAEFSGGSNTDKDEFGHGSHVATLAAGSDGKGSDSNDRRYLVDYQGIAPAAKVINVRVLDKDGKGTTARLISALNWIYTNRTSKNIKIVNMSLGTPAIETWRNDPLCRAARKLVDAGIVVVAAAGNNGKNNAGQKLYGAIHSPGNDPSVITVGATNSFGTDARGDDGIATYSSRGPTRSFYTDAQGVKQHDHLIKPDLVAPGNKLIGAEAKDNGIIDANGDLEVNNGADDKRRMMYLSGTSMATPIVSGTAALLLQANPKLTPNMIKMILMYTAQPVRGANQLEQGAGQLNIEGAVRLARSIRQDMGTTPAPGTKMQTSNTLPSPQSTIAGQTFSWS